MGYFFVLLMTEYSREYKDECDDRRFWPMITPRGVIVGVVTRSWLGLGTEASDCKQVSQKASSYVVSPKHD